MTPDHSPETLPRVRPQSDVDHARLVFQGQEDGAASSHRVLAGYDEPGNPDRPRPSIRQRGVGYGTEPLQRGPEERDHLPAGVER